MRQMLLAMLMLLLYPLTATAISDQKICKQLLTAHGEKFEKYYRMLGEREMTYEECAAWQLKYLKGKGRMAKLLGKSPTGATRTYDIRHKDLNINAGTQDQLYKDKEGRTCIRTGVDSDRVVCEAKE